MVMDRRRTLVSKHFGEVEWDPASELLLPCGLPGFEDERRMVAVEIPAQRPLVYLQSAEKAEICFVALPVRAVQPDYRLELSEDDKIALRLDEDCRPEIGADVLCLALLIPFDGGVETNLAAPIVVNLHNLRCVQARGPGCTPVRYRLAEGSWAHLC